MRKPGISPAVPFGSRLIPLLLLTAWGLLILAVASPALGDHRAGGGSIRHSRRYDSNRYHTYRYDIEYRDRDAVRLQDQSISASEEVRREEGRKLRREEVEEDVKAREEAFLESQEAVRSASWAAERTPRGAYYRRPGSRTSSLPRGHQVVDVGGASYYFYEGIFFKEEAGGYVAVTAPAGARIGSLPAGRLRISHDSSFYHYYFGSFFSETDGAFTVVYPPAGLLVPYLPDGYFTEHREGLLHYVFGGVAYRPFYAEGVLVFSVSDS
jgi:hypothetical protein